MDELVAAEVRRAALQEVLDLIKDVRAARLTAGIPARITPLLELEVLVERLRDGKS